MKSQFWLCPCFHRTGCFPDMVRAVVAGGTAGLGVPPDSWAGGLCCGRLVEWWSVSLLSEVLVLGSISSCLNTTNHSVILCVLNFNYLVLSPHSSPLTCVSCPCRDVCFQKHLEKMHTLRKWAFAKRELKTYSRNLAWKKSHSRVWLIQLSHQGLSRQSEQAHWWKTSANALSIKCRLWS